MLKRRGYGAGKGKGYKNLMPIDSFVHSLNAKGVKKQPIIVHKKRTAFLKNFLNISNPKNMTEDMIPDNFGRVPTYKKKGLIKELARKVEDGVGWAIKWEQEHLPQQKAWVKKEYERAKQLTKKGVDKLKKIKAKDMEDVRDELDSNDDGVQDIPMQELETVNEGIRKDLQGIDLNQDGVADYVQEQPLDDYETEYADSTESTIIPIPKPKKGVVQKAKETAILGFQKGKTFVKERQAIAKAEKEELKSYSNNTLEELAIREPKGMFGFGKNKYEKELLRRVEYKNRLDEEIRQVKMKPVKVKSQSSLNLAESLGFTKKVKIK